MSQLAQIDPFHAIGIGAATQAEGRGRFDHPHGVRPALDRAASAAIAVAHEMLDADRGGYWESAPLRARMTRHYLETYGVTVAPERMILTCGASPALVLALASVFNPGDRISPGAPGYVAYRNPLKALHMEPVEITCGAESRFQLTAAHLAALDPAPAGVIVASPANPTGTIIEPAELEAIAKVCRERGIRIVSDEIYHGLSYVGPARSMLEFEPDTLVVNSFSKYFSMVGWRLGWLLAPERDLSRARAYVGNLFLTAPSFSQHVGLAAMDEHAGTGRQCRGLPRQSRPAAGGPAEARPDPDVAQPDGAF